MKKIHRQLIIKNASRLSKMFKKNHRNRIKFSHKTQDGESSFMYSRKTRFTIYKNNGPCYHDAYSLHYIIKPMSDHEKARVLRRIVCGHDTPDIRVSEGRCKKITASSYEIKKEVANYLWERRSRE